MIRIRRRPSKIVCTVDSWLDEISPLHFVPVEMTIGALALRSRLRDVSLDSRKRLGSHIVGRIEGLNSEFVESDVVDCAEDGGSAEE